MSVGILLCKGADLFGGAFYAFDFSHSFAVLCSPVWMATFLAVNRNRIEKIRVSFF